MAAHHHHGAQPHDHAHASGEEWRVGGAAALTGLFMLVEVAGGILAGSLALLADAGHMLSDTAGLGLAWFAFRMARRPADRRRTYGFDRFQVLTAFVNGAMLILIAGWILYEAASRLLVAPRDVLAGPMLAIAAMGLAVNVLAFWVLHGADRSNLNVRGAMLHVIGDLLGSVAAIAAAAIILLTGWMAADPVLSVLVALIILRSAWALVKASAHILLEGAPEGIDTREIEADLEAAIAEVLDVHHVHAWSITNARPMITLHARTEAGAAPAQVTADIKARLKARFGITHATVEIEHEDCADAQKPAPAG